MIANPLPPGEIARRGTEFYERHLRQSVEREHFGRYLVLDVETGEYEIDSDHLAASNRAVAKRPNAILFTLRIGYRSGGRIGPRARVAQR